MRILQVFQFYYPWVKASSTGKVAYKISRYLLRHGILVDLVTTDYQRYSLRGETMSSQAY